ncbi:MAG: RNA polymerase sigma factor FliA [Gammaproteobacteria bacterium]|jgi:RNA polymerase sigma factor for flagellar operon FliA
MNNLVYSRDNLGSLHIVIQKYANLVKKIAHHLLGRLPPSVQSEDLIQAGMIGLLEAYRNYDEYKGASFETYAGIRIRGSMLDEIRKGDWVPRSVHKNSRKISNAIRKIENQIGRDPKDRDIAKALDISLDCYHQLLQDSIGAKIFGFEDMGITVDAIVDSGRDPLPGPLEKIQRTDFKEHLATLISGLCHKESLVLTLYYNEELNLKEIGEVLGVSESRISQIHSQAMLKLKSKINDFDCE